MAVPALAVAAMLEARVATGGPPAINQNLYGMGMVELQLGIHFVKQGACSCIHSAVLVAVSVECVAADPVLYLLHPPAP